MIRNGLGVLCLMIFCEGVYGNVPKLLTSGTRVLAVESPTMAGEPFAITANVPFSLDPRTRVMVFASGLDAPVWPYNGYASIDAEDGLHRHFDLPIEARYHLDENPDISVLIVRLDGLLSDEGDLLIQLFWDGVGSNRARIGVGHIGGGPVGPNCPATNLVFDGNSLTWGMGATQPDKGLPFPTDYPAVAMNLLGCGYDYQNFAVVGQTTEQMISDAEAQIDSQIKPNTRNVLVVWEGSNEMTEAWHQNPQQAFDHIATYCRGRRQAGYRILLLSVLPRSDMWVFADFEGKRQTLNSLLRDRFREFSDVLVDVGADPVIGKPEDPLNTFYYTLDRVHLTDAGYAIIATYVSQSLAEMP